MTVSMSARLSGPVAGNTIIVSQICMLTIRMAVKSNGCVILATQHDTMKAFTRSSHSRPLNQMRIKSRSALYAGHPDMFCIGDLLGIRAVLEVAE
jgi:hypothetical protein